MICGIIGNVLELSAMSVEIEANGVVYELAISVQTSARLKLGEKVHLRATHIVREDADLLFGFLDKIEQSTFERLLKINGVGPKVALAILSTFSPQSFAALVQSKDIKLLQKVPGVGAKSAGKILLDLAGFCSQILQEQNVDLAREDISGEDFGDIATKKARNEAVAALQTLGYKLAEIKKVLPQIKASDSPNIIKEALKLL